MTSRLIAVVLVAAWAAAGVRPAAAQAAFPAPVEADFVARDVAFASGERLPEVRLHYRTVGTPRKDADGVVRNGVLDPARHRRLRRRLPGRRLRRTAVRQGPAARRRALLHHPARQRRPRPVEQAERRAADEVPGLPLHRHGAAAAPPGHRGARTHPPAPGDGHVDGRDAQLDVGLHVSRRSPTAWCRWPATRSRSPAATGSGARRWSTPSSPIRPGRTATTPSRRAAWPAPWASC